MATAGANAQPGQQCCACKDHGESYCEVDTLLLGRNTQSDVLKSQADDSHLSP
jgi:hypothetical protein